MALPRAGLQCQIQFIGRRPQLVIVRLGKWPLRCDVSSECAAPTPSRWNVLSTTSVMTIPNLISIGRLLLVPVIVVLTLKGLHATALVVFVIAGVSDAADGIIARWMDARSDLGAILDPLADKALLVSIFVVLAADGALPVWLSVLVVGRDALILGAVMLAWLAGRPLTIAPLLASKVNTATQIVLAAAVLTQLGLHLQIEGLIQALIVVATITTVVSGVDYLQAWLRQTREAGVRLSRTRQI